VSRVALAPGHAREYETIYLMRPNLGREAADDIATRVTEALRTHDGTLTHAELWGSRRLAYPIKNHHRATYVFLKYLGKGHTVSEIERQLRLADSIIRFQTIQVGANVPVAGVEAAPEQLKQIDFEMAPVADEPELTRERELGLDQTGMERRRRDERDGDDDMDMDGDEMGGGGGGGGDDDEAEES
jgi:small subunit ribosomal protein S6